LTASTGVELVVAPAEDDAEEGDAVVIERQWDMELRYLISIGGRNYPQGSEVGVHAAQFSFDISFSISDL
jgi:hypothetical protein